MMNDEVYRQLRETLARRGRGVRDIPEFYEMVRVLFTPEEAEIQNAMPAGLFTPDVVSRETGKSEAEVTAILEAMADKGLCLSIVREGTWYYSGPAFVPGILEYQFMWGTKTDRDYEIARAMNAYRKAAARATTVGCDEEAITLVERAGDFVPPTDLMALRETIIKKRSEGAS